MGVPGSIASSVPDGPDWLVRAVRDLQREVAALRTARDLEAATIGSGGITVNGGVIQSGDFDGDVDTADPGTQGWALGGSHNNAVFGTLALRDGIVGDDALANPIRADHASDTASDFSISNSPVAKCSTTIAVPAGFSRAIVQATTDVVVFNENAFGVVVNCYTEIAGDSPEFHPAVSMDASKFASVSSTYGVLLTGLSGGTISVKSYVYCSSSVPADGSNGAQVYATAVFLR